MTTPCVPLPPPADLLGEVLHLLRITGTLYCQAECTAPWGVDVPQLDGLMTALVVGSGHCWLDVDGLDPVRLGPGSLTLIPHGTPHRMRSDPDAPADPLFDLPVEKVSERYEVMRHGGGGEASSLTYVVMEVDQVVAHRLVGQLPRVVRLDTWEADDGGWLHQTVRFMAREAAQLRPGGEIVITRLADVLVVQALRSWLETAPQPAHGWLAALRDPQLGGVLRAIHRDPGAPWTLPGLAAQAGMSRSAFAERFRELVGEPAVQYLTRWRLGLSRDHLRRTDEPLTTVARRFGYASQAAFSRAFAREFGCPPGAVRAAAGAAGAAG